MKLMEIGIIKYGPVVGIKQKGKYLKFFINLFILFISLSTIETHINQFNLLSYLLSRVW
jgi:hypothetical protein